jgi:hypothetical protein
MALNTKKTQISFLSLEGARDNFILIFPLWAFPVIKINVISFYTRQSQRDFVGKDES